MASYVGEARNRRPSPAPGSDPAEVYDFLSRGRNVRYVSRQLGELIAANFADCDWLVGTARAHYLLPQVVREVRRANHHRIKARRAWPAENGRATIEGGINCDQASVVILALQTGDHHPGQAGAIIRALSADCISGIVAVRSIGRVESSIPPIYSLYQSPLEMQTGLRYNGRPAPMIKPDTTPPNPFLPKLYKSLSVPDATDGVLRNVGDLLDMTFPGCQTVVTTPEAGLLTGVLKAGDLGVKGFFLAHQPLGEEPPGGVVIVDAYCGDRTDAINQMAANLSDQGIQVLGSITARIVDHPGCSPAIHDYIASRL